VLASPHVPEPVSCDARQLDSEFLRTQSVSPDGLTGHIVKRPTVSVPVRADP
jgi:hypothetical protein